MPYSVTRSIYFGGSFLPAAPFLISAIIVFHALRGSAYVRAGAKGREKSRLRPRDGEKYIFAATGVREKKKEERERKRGAKSEITGDGKSDEALAAIREESASFHFIAPIVGPSGKYGNVTVCLPEGVSQSRSRFSQPISLGKRAGCRGPRDIRLRKTSL